MAGGDMHIARQMKAACLLLLISMFLTGNEIAFAQNGTVKPDRLRFAGRDFVRLGEWARENHYDVHWLKMNEALQLTNRFSRLVFAKDSTETEINGVRVRLCYPIVMKDGAAYIADMDLYETLRPVLSPPRDGRRKKIWNVVIDPGHGGNDPGFEAGGHQEKKYTLLLAQELCDQLKRAGFKASLTRTGDASLDKPLRPDIARRRLADLFISLHWNSAGQGGSEVKGVETYCLTPAGAPSSNSGNDVSGAETRAGNRFNAENMYLAYVLQRSLARELGAEDRGVHRARFAVLCPAVMPAVLIEGGYMSNAAESKRIYDAGYRRQMAKAIVDGVQSYRRQVEE
jgi:N-acetylmuramoyl-L-alanine amidase